MLWETLNVLQIIITIVILWVTFPIGVKRPNNNAQRHFHILNPYIRQTADNILLLIDIYWNCMCLEWKWLQVSLFDRKFEKVITNASWTTINVIYLLIYLEAGEPIQIDLHVVVVLLLFDLKYFWQETFRSHKPNFHLPSMEMGERIKVESIWKSLSNYFPKSS